MTPEEKAKELVERFYKPIDWDTRAMYDVKMKVAKQCALICVDNEYRARLEEVEKVSDYIPCEIYSQQVIFIQKEWVKVKQEIQKL